MTKHAMRPSFERQKPVVLREVPPLEVLQKRFLVPGMNSYLRVYKIDQPGSSSECSVIATKEHGRWHLSIAGVHRMPTWDQIAAVRYQLIPDSVIMAIVLPDRKFYINLHEFCVQMFEIHDPNHGDFSEG